MSINLEPMAKGCIPRRVVGFAGSSKDLGGSLLAVAWWLCFGGAKTKT